MSPYIYIDPVVFQLGQTIVRPPGRTFFFPFRSFHRTLTALKRARKPQERICHLRWYLCPHEAATRSVAPRKPNNEKEQKRASPIRAALFRTQIALCPVPHLCHCEPVRTLAWQSASPVIARRAATWGLPFRVQSASPVIARSVSDVAIRSFPAPGNHTTALGNHREPHNNTGELHKRSREL